jgi:hypothetical protein
VNASGSGVGAFWITALILWGVGLLILYAVIRAAVKTAIKEALTELGILNWMSNVYTAIGRPDEPPSSGEG